MTRRKLRPSLAKRFNHQNIDSFNLSLIRFTFFHNVPKTRRGVFARSGLQQGNGDGEKVTKRVRETKYGSFICLEIL